MPRFIFHLLLPFVICHLHGDQLLDPFLSRNVEKRDAEHKKYAYSTHTLPLGKKYSLLREHRVCTPPQVQTGKSGQNRISYVSQNAYIYRCRLSNHSIVQYKRTADKFRKYSWCKRSS